MTQLQVYFDGKEEEIIEKYKRKWGLSKHETIKRIIREFKEIRDGSNR